MRRVFPVPPPGPVTPSDVPVDRRRRLLAATGLAAVTPAWAWTAGRGTGGDGDSDSDSDGDGHPADDAAPGAPSPAGAHTMADRGRLLPIDPGLRLPDGERRLRLWLPPDTAAAAGPTATVYLIDGPGWFDAADLRHAPLPAAVLGSLARAGRIPRTAVVAVAPRAGSAAADAWPLASLMTLHVGWRAPAVRRLGAVPRAEDWLDAVADDLKPRLDARFGLDPRPSHTVVLGTGPTAVLALAALGRRPDRYGAAIGLAGGGLAGSRTAGAPGGEDPGAQDGDAWPAMRRALQQWFAVNLPAPGRHRLWWDPGPQPPGPGHATAEDGIAQALSLRRWMHGLNWRRPEASLATGGRTAARRRPPARQGGASGDFLAPAFAFALGGRST